MQPLEISFFDTGDFRPVTVTVKRTNGEYISDFAYQSFEVLAKKPPVLGLPYGRDCETSQTLSITLKSQQQDVYCVVNYTVYPEIDVIIRNVEIINESNEELEVEKCFSSTLDLPESGYKMLTLHGIPANERKRHIQPIPYGKYCSSSANGTTGSFSSPFAIVAEEGAGENEGLAYGVNLVYSGNFAFETYLDDFERTRLNIGVNPEMFLYTLKKGERFCSPEAILTCSINGYNGVSIAFANYIKEYIMPKQWAKTPRPVVLNTWEAFVFDINEEKLLDCADLAIKAGVDTLVIDDGWFSSRRNDDRGLGDWYPAKEIFPNGLKSFAQKLKAKGIHFGIWIEPEMVSPNSELFRKHPEWALGSGSEKFLSREQLVLDMTNPEVVEYVFQSFVKCFEGVDISYIKWDMNRWICPYVSSYTKKNKEVAHRYVMGVYTLLKRMTEHFKDVIFESCSGGGGRFDAAMLAYTPQIWTSDNTDPFERSYIQAGASYFMPLSSMSCHVTEDHNIGTRLETTLDFRYGVALNGILGYEFDLFKLSEEELAEIKRQIEKYRKLQELTLDGDFYRTVTPFDGNVYAYSIVSKDKKRAVFSANVLRNGRNFPHMYLKIYGLADDMLYEIDGKTLSGKALRTHGILLLFTERSGQTFFYEIKAV